MVKKVKYCDKKIVPAGFTIVEMLVVIFIMTVFSTLFLAYYRNNQRQYQLNMVVQTMASDFRRTQNSALAGTAQSAGIPFGYGIHVESASQYTLFYNGPQQPPGQLYNYKKPPGNSSIDLETVNLPTGVTIAPTSQDVFFIPPDPTTYFNGSLAASGTSLQFTLTAAGGLSKTITVYSNGRIEF